ncbi:hypothetical protein SAICODRAFT_200607 [Saitoella complicata NRRL Y-17804]|uniref:Uncharacterized protein n=1 Tax=Saitoella complicata (strain BCRC 22490 / CBS 7301 / JCM 7358 / NBRC 10748 / NRRL Y-17804) TaxID=698492 RepID=A0A0E9NTL8_SAICN|nr:uncharacterized protein SAICODRAFT_200607 [Saitoella complicata NRRL Y-17804]ODQ55182.1 hypothetical protein SAICODRAFT_200607 [Saitoella complicata NRRL Y-17804]GAO52750.1 hypothetical protein G7K_6819-t1 [Saitoella complicata NRRL Y-17804]
MCTRSISGLDSELIRAKVGLVSTRMIAWNNECCHVYWGMCVLIFTVDLLDIVEHKIGTPTCVEYLKYCRSASQTDGTIHQIFHLTTTGKGQKNGSFFTALSTSRYIRLSIPISSSPSPPTNIHAQTRVQIRGSKVSRNEKQKHETKKEINARKPSPSPSPSPSP